jgi:site-specific recombinase XerD
MFAVYTGISFADLSKLTREHIYIGIDGALWMHFKRQKTKIKSAVPLLAPARKIYDEYERFAPAGKTRKVFPLPSNQATNRALKQLAALAHIAKPITFHMARHTFATTITLSNNVPLETVSRMLGHASISTTQIYAKIVDNKISGDMANLMDRYNGVPEKATKLIITK